MAYKVFLVEDEITTREGIRDNVDWESVGFQLCGEAPDGEIALPQIEATQPDVLITDIKMPFMDGLQLCRIIHENMPWMKIIIISGYNDFQYAQTAIKLGVSEYLLKPVSMKDLLTVLRKVAVDLDHEQSERAYLKQLRSQVEDNLALLREKFLMRLVTGGESSISAIEQSQQLGLNILAPVYQVILLELQPPQGSQYVDYPISQAVEKILSEIVGNSPDILMSKKSIDCYVLILKGESLEQVEQESAFLAKLIADEVNRNTACVAVVGIGTRQRRLGDLHQSYMEALVSVKRHSSAVHGDSPRLDHAEVNQFLQSASREEIDDYCRQTMQPLFESAAHSPLLRHYLLLDLALTAAQYVSDLGGNEREILPAEIRPEYLPEEELPPDQMVEEAIRLISAAIGYRDSLTANTRAAIVQQAKAFIAERFSDPDISLNDLAARANFSPNHFSAVFSSETGIPFRNYLTQVRMENAKKLLSTTSLKCSDIAFRCGYNDPHYFSIVFRKMYHLTPQQYRAKARKETRQVE